MTEKILTPKGTPKTVGLRSLIEAFNLKVPLPTVRSEVISGARKTTVADGTVREQLNISITASKRRFGETLGRK